MRKILLFSCFLMFSWLNYAQDPDIYGEWHLHNHIYNGEDHIPNHLELPLICEFYEDSGLNYFYFPNDVVLQTFSVDHGSTNTAFILTEFVALQDGICYDQPCIDFFLFYKSFYYLYEGTIMNYEIIDNSNGSKTLIVTNIDGDQAIYNTDPLLLEITEYSQVSFVISPNPVSETLFIRAEKLQIENLTVFNLAGQTVLSENRNVNELNVSSLSEGFYFLEITSEAGKQIQKFIKQLQ